MKTFQSHQTKGQWGCKALFTHLWHNSSRTNENSTYFIKKFKFEFEQPRFPNISANTKQWFYLFMFDCSNPFVFPSHLPGCVSAKWHSIMSGFRDIAFFLYLSHHIKVMQKTSYYTTLHGWNSSPKKICMRPPIF